MQRHEKSAFTVARVFFDQYLLVAEITDAAAAVFLLRPHQQIAERAGLAERVAIDGTLFAPALAVGADFRLKKSPRRFAELFVLGFEDVATHGPGVIATNFV